MSVAWYWPDWNPANCSDPPGESCSDADCPVHGWPVVDDELADEDDQ